MKQTNLRTGLLKKGHLTRIFFVGIFFSGLLAQAAPKGGVFFYNLGGEPATLNPIAVADFYGETVLRWTNDSLLTQNIDSNEWQPGLAESWEVAKDSKSYTFHLRKDLKFADGSPLTADDVKFSFEVIFDEAYSAISRRVYLDSIEKAEVLDPFTVKFTIKAPYFGNFNQLAGLRIIPKSIYGDSRKGSKLAKTIMGSGPYKLEKYEPGQQITLVRNPLWWGTRIEALQDQANFDKIVLRFVNDENRALEMLKKGELDYTALSPEGFVKKAVGIEWGKTVEKIKTENKEPKSYSFVGWNLRNDLFKDRQVRQALLMLMNRDLMNEKFKFGMWATVTGPWDASSDSNHPVLKEVKFNPTQAASLLKKAGWSDSDKDGVLDKVIDGKKVNFEFTVLYANKDSEKFLNLYKDDLKKAGLRMNLKWLDWDAFLKALQAAQFEAMAMSWGGGDVDYDPKQIWHSSSALSGGSNFINYANPAVDKLIDEGRRELDRSKRLKKFRKAYELIATDTPYAWMFTPRSVLYATTTRIGKPRETFNYSLGVSTWWVVPHSGSSK
jgi:peptide/nickel transport system substrate-binding protein/microcin C transport system substrate-binding protein